MKKYKVQPTDKDQHLSNLEILCFGCEKDEEPTMINTNTDGEGSWRYECPACDNIIMIWKGGEN